VIGTTFAWTLGIGLLLLAVLATSSGGGNGVTAANTLFGSIYSLSAADARVAGAVALATIAALALVLRPLLFSTLDPEVAIVRGLPVRLLGAAFLCLLAVVTADTTQAVGALLLLGLIAAPAGAAHLLTARPYFGMLLAGALALGAMWAGLALSYAIPSLPPSSAIIGLAAGCYLVAAVVERAQR
jgi:zinc/manganese transport system permease protein